MGAASDGDGTDRRPGGCFHGWRSCRFCGYPYPARGRRARCSTCGRFVRSRSHGDDRCGPCCQRGYEALRLFAA